MKFRPSPSFSFSFFVLFVRFVHFHGGCSKRYNLVITKEASKDSTLLQKHVETHVDGAELLSDVGTEVSFQVSLWNTRLANEAKH